MLFKYKIFGYRVLSEIELDAFLCDFIEIPDISIVYNDLSYTQMTLDETGFIFNKGHIIMHIKNIAVYKILNGSIISIAPYIEASKSEIQLFLLGSAFGFIMHQRNEFPLHGSAVEINDKCVVVVGASGAGKSSLACGFIKRGYKLLADDVARITVDSSTYYVHSSYPSQKIWLDVIERLSIPYDPQNQIVNRFDKYYVNTLDRFSDSIRPIQAIIELMSDDVNELTLIELKSKDKLNALIMHSYRQEIMGSYMDLNAHLKWCAALSRNIPVYRILRPRTGFYVDEQVNLTLNILKNII